MLDIQKVHSFCEAADCLNFTEAASRLYSTQSSLSKNIANLERTIGCKLFVRSNRNVTLTPAGKYLHSYFKNMLTDMQQTLTHARELNEGKHGFLRIGILGLGSIVEEISSIFLNFYKIHPSYSFEFIPMTAKETRDLLISRRIDAVITNQQDLALLIDCDYEVVLTSNLVAIARNDHPLFTKHAAPVLSDLKDYGFVIISPDFSPHTYRMTHKVCEVNGFFPKIKVTAATLFGLMMNVAASDYVAITSECDSRGRNTLRQIPVESTDTVNTVLAWNRNNSSDALHELIEFVRVL